MCLEMCCNCDNPTGKAGRCEDSMYLGDKGPYCEECYDKKCEKLSEELQDIRAELAVANQQLDLCIKASGVVKHTDLAECVGCGCMQLTAEECVGVVVDKLAAAEKCAESNNASLISLWRFLTGDDVHEVPEGKRPCGQAIGRIKAAEALLTEAWNAVGVVGVDEPTTLADGIRCRIEWQKEAEQRADDAEVLAKTLRVALDRVATDSTHPDRDGPGCWWCAAEDGEPHHDDCTYLILIATDAATKGHHDESKQMPQL